MTLFIVGSGRCGTGLLRRMLDLHPSMHVIHESHWVPRMYRRFGLREAPRAELIGIVRRTRFVDGSPTLALDEAVLADLDYLPDHVSVAEFCGALGGLLARRAGKSMWADKTPEYGLHMRTIQTLWPDARFLNLTRDGPDVTASMARHPGYQAMVALDQCDWTELAVGWSPSRISEERLAQIRSGPKDPFTRLWRRRVISIARESLRLRPGSYQELCYEQLVSDPAQALADVAAFAGLEVDSEWLAAAAALIDPVKAARASRSSPIPPHYSPDERTLALTLRNGAGPTDLVDGLRVVKPPPSRAPSTVQLFSCVRNESLRLPFFLDYYRSLGVERFFIVDNGSTDGTLEYLRGQADVALFDTRESYATSGHGVAWLNELLDDWSVDRWALIVDADEQLVYPHSETLSLPELVRYLDERGDEAMSTPLLDMYARGPIVETGYEPGRPFTLSAPFFDADAAKYIGISSGQAGQDGWGGPRERLFWAGHELDHRSPYLRKKALVRWRRGLALTRSTHVLRDVVVSQTTGVLLHFKLLQDFVERVPEEAVRGEHHGGARQYATYAGGVSREPSLSAWYEGSVAFRDTAQLMTLGLMGAGPGYPEPESSRAPDPSAIEPR